MNSNLKFVIFVILLNVSYIKSITNFLGIGIEKPKYEVLGSLGNNMEIRKYAPSKWVSTSVEGKLDNYRSKYQKDMFNNLFKYISGENDKKEKIAMTAPVTVVFNSNSIVQQKSEVKLTMSFYIPRDKQAQTPNPTNKDTFLRSEPETTAAVIKFGGLATPNDFLKHRDILIRTLGEEAKKYDTLNTITASYDPPFKLIARTNEVWLRKIN